MSTWEDLPEDLDVILQAMPYRSEVHFEWSVRPGLTRSRTLEIEGWLHDRMTAWKQGRGLEDAPWMWDNAAARYQLLGRRVEIG